MGHLGKGLVELNTWREIENRIELLKYKAR